MMGVSISKTTTMLWHICLLNAVRLTAQSIIATPSQLRGQQQQLDQSDDRKMDLILDIEALETLQYPVRVDINKQDQRGRGLLVEPDSSWSNMTQFDWITVLASAPPNETTTDTNDTEISKPSRDADKPPRNKTVEIIYAEGKPSQYFDWIKDLNKYRKEKKRSLTSVPTSSDMFDIIPVPSPSFPSDLQRQDSISPTTSSPTSTLSPSISASPSSESPSPTMSPVGMPTNIPTLLPTKESNDKKGMMKMMMMKMKKDKNKSKKMTKGKDTKGSKGMMMKTKDKKKGDDECDDDESPKDNDKMGKMKKKDGCKMKMNIFMRRPTRVPTVQPTIFSSASDQPSFIRGGPGVGTKAPAIPVPVQVPLGRTGSEDNRIPDGIPSLDELLGRTKRPTVVNASDQPTATSSSPILDGSESPSSSPIQSTVAPSETPVSNIIPTAATSVPSILATSVPSIAATFDSIEPSTVPTGAPVVSDIIPSSAPTFIPSISPVSSTSMEPTEIQAVDTLEPTSSLVDDFLTPTAAIATFNPSTKPTPKPTSISPTSTDGPTTDVPTSLITTTPYPTQLSTDDFSDRPTLTGAGNDGSIVKRRINLQPYFIAFSAPLARRQPTTDEYEALNYENMMYWNEWFNNIYRNYFDDYFQSIAIQSNVTKVLFEMGIPDTQFNIYIEFYAWAEVAFNEDFETDSDSDALSTLLDPEEIFAEMKRSIGPKYLFKRVRSLKGTPFVSTNEVFFRRLESSNTTSSPVSTDGDVMNSRGSTAPTPSETRPEPNGNENEDSGGRSNGNQENADLASFDLFGQRRRSLSLYDATHYDIKNEAPTKWMSHYNDRRQLTTFYTSSDTENKGIGYNHDLSEMKFFPIQKEEPPKNIDMVTADGQDSFTNDRLQMAEPTGIDTESNENKNGNPSISSNLPSDFDSVLDNLIDVGPSPSKPHSVDFSIGGKEIDLRGRLRHRRRRAGNAKNGRLDYNQGRGKRQQQDSSKSFSKPSTVPCRYDAKFATKRDKKMQRRPRQQKQKKRNSGDGDISSHTYQQNETNYNVLKLNQISRSQNVFHPIGKGSSSNKTNRGCIPIRVPMPTRSPSSRPKGGPAKQIRPAVRQPT